MIPFTVKAARCKRSASDAGIGPTGYPNSAEFVLGDGG